MGLDIYCRWDNFSAADKRAQFTGMVCRGKTGYVRYGWAGLAFVGEVSHHLGILSPINALYPGWDGYNDEELQVTPQELERLQRDRETLKAWLAENKGRISPSGQVEGWSYFLESVEETINFINFVEAHKEQAGLRICFY